MIRLEPLYVTESRFRIAYRSLMKEAETRTIYVSRNGKLLTVLLPIEEYQKLKRYAPRSATYNRVQAERWKAENRAAIEAYNNRMEDRPTPILPIFSRASTEDDLGRAPLLSVRIPRAHVVLGSAYVIHARNGGVGVAVMVNGELGYRLRREKGGRTYLFTELDWSQGPPFGTAIPLYPVEEPPPDDDAQLLDWLQSHEAKHKVTVDRAWDVVLGKQKDLGGI